MTFLKVKWSTRQAIMVKIRNEQHTRLGLNWFELTLLCPQGMKWSFFHLLQFSKKWVYKFGLSKSGLQGLLHLSKRRVYLYGIISQVWDSYFKINKFALEMRVFSVDNDGFLHNQLRLSFCLMDWRCFFAMASKYGPEFKQVWFRESTSYNVSTPLNLWWYVEDCGRVINNLSSSV